MKSVGLIFVFRCQNLFTFFHKIEARWFFSIICASKFVFLETLSKIQQLYKTIFKKRENFIFFTVSVVILQIHLAMRNIFWNKLCFKNSKRKLKIKKKQNKKIENAKMHTNPCSLYNLKLFIYLWKFNHPFFDLPILNTQSNPV